MYHAKVLTNREAEHVVVCRESKPELPRVMTNNLSG